MAGDLITLPVRLGIRSAQVLTRAAVGATGRAASLAGRAIQTAIPGGSGGDTGDASPVSPQQRESDARTPAQTPARPEPKQPPSARAEPPADPRREPVEAPVPAPEPRTARPPAPREEPTPPSQTPLADEPSHVSEEPALVREEAEIGAEEGAGADVTVLEPWEGYARMSAEDVIARAMESSPAELAAIRLYEPRHRGRQTVLDAVDRQLKTINSSGRPA